MHGCYLLDFLGRGVCGVVCRLFGKGVLWVVFGLDWTVGFGFVMCLPLCTDVVVYLCLEGCNNSIHYSLFSMFITLDWCLLFVVC